MKYDNNSQRQRLTDVANSKAILEVAQSFGMELEKEGKEFSGKWQGHESFKLNGQANQFYWNGRGFGGGVIDLVSVLKYGATSHEEAQKYAKRSIVSLAKMEIGTFEPINNPKKQPFHFFYDEDDNFDLGRVFLKEKRGLSDETIDFFLENGVISQGKYRTELENGEYFFEPAIFFKTLDLEGKIIGGSVHGLEPHPGLPGHKHKSGILKKALLNSGSYSGLKVTIGTPKSVIPLEAPIDLMSYYELHKETLKDVVLVANDGYKPEAYWRAMAETIVSSPLVNNDKYHHKEALVQRLIDSPDDFLRKNYHSFITLSEPQAGRFIFAFDNDKAGHEFIEKFKVSYPDVLKKIETDLPPLVEDQEKSDWNDELKYQKNIIPRPKSQSEIEQIEEIVSKYSNPKAAPINSNPTSGTSKFVKQTISRINSKGKPYTISKIYELLNLTDYSKLETDRTGRLSLEAVSVLTLEQNDSKFEEAKNSFDKTIKSSRFILSINVPSEQLSRPTLEEIRQLRQAKNGIINSKNKKNPDAQTAPKANDTGNDLTALLQKREIDKLHHYLSDDLKKYKEDKPFHQFLKVLTFMPEQTEKNIRLLIAQNPNVSQVADFTTWSDIKKRKIKAKSKALKIILPNPQLERDESGKVILNAKGEPKIEKVIESVVSVFDESQTTGQSLIPSIVEEIPRERALEIFQDLAQLSTASIRFTENPIELEERAISFEHSWMIPSQKELYIQKGLPPKEALKTLVQELVFQNSSLSSGNQELEQLKIEATSYILLRRQGIEVTPPSVKNLSISHDNLSIILSQIQEGSNQMSQIFDKQLKPKTIKNYEQMTSIDKNRKLTLKEKMEAAKSKEAELGEAVDTSKKALGVEHHQAPQI